MVSEYENICEKQLKNTTLKIVKYKDYYIIRAYDEVDYVDLLWCGDEECAIDHFNIICDIL